MITDLRSLIKRLTNELAVEHAGLLHERDGGEHNPASQRYTGPCDTCRLVEEARAVVAVTMLSMAGPINVEIPDPPVAPTRPEPPPDEPKIPTLPWWTPSDLKRLASPEL